MEWVETTAATLEQAKDLLLDQLGVDEQEAEFEVLEEPKAGLFGRVRGQFRVKARIAPKSQRTRDDKRRRPAKPKGSGGSGNDNGGGEARAAASESAPASDAAPAPAAPRPARAPRAESAASEDRAPVTADQLATMITDVTAYLEGILREFGLEGTVSVVADDEGILVASVSGSSLGSLIGPRGGMLHALEELCRTRVQHSANGGSAPRLRLDIGGYRELRRDHLVELVNDVVERVRETGKPHVLDVLTSAERKLVHDTVGAFDDVTTRSEGEEPNRRVAVVVSES